MITTIAVFHCTASVDSAWGCAEGIVKTLMNMGYNVLDCGRPEHKKVTLSQLETADLILLSGPEWYYDKIPATFGSSWFKIKAQKIAWFTESAHRDDREFQFQNVIKYVDSSYFPAIQDATEFKGKWLPFGADTEIFKPYKPDKIHDAVFIGQMYQKRSDFIKRINCQIKRLETVTDPDLVKSFTKLAEAYNSTKIFVNLPTLSRLLVTKVTEVMACRTMLITPHIDHFSGTRNEDIFQDRKHLVYYDSSNPNNLSKKIEYYLKNPEEREFIAENGYQEVKKNYSLENQLSRIIDDVLSQKSQAVMSSLKKQNYIRNICSTSKLVFKSIFNKSQTTTPRKTSEKFFFHETNYGNFMICNSLETIQSSLLKNGSFEPLGSNIAIAFSKTCEGAVLDVGANMGVFTVPVARSLPEKEIYSIEPQKMVFMHLCTNVLINNLKNVKCYNVAVSDNCEKQTIAVPLFDVFTEHFTGSVSLDSKTQNIRSRIANVFEPSQWCDRYDQVPLKSIDELVGDCAISFIKIDVEGMELHVLKSASNVISKNKPFIFFETLSLPEFEFLRFEINQWLSDIGYKIISFNDDSFAYHSSVISEEDVIKRIRLIPDHN
jgi:FkbM family methyltransferase